MQPTRVSLAGSGGSERVFASETPQEPFSRHPMHVPDSLRWFAPSGELVGKLHSRPRDANALSKRPGAWQRGVSD